MRKPGRSPSCPTLSRNYRLRTVGRTCFQVPRLALLVIAQLAMSFGAVSAEVFFKTVRLDPVDPSVNCLSIQSEPADGIDYLAYETNGLVLSDRIEIRLAAVQDILLVSAPANWRMQTTPVVEHGLDVKVVSFFYQGTDPGNAGEFFNFATPWVITFRIGGPEPEPGGMDPPLTTLFPVSVEASTIVPGFGVIPVTESFSLAATLSSPETQQPFSASLERFTETSTTLRFELALPGIRYRIDSSGDLENWSERLTFEPTTLVSDHLLTLTGGGGRREFFRVILTPVMAAPAN